MYGLFSNRRRFSPVFRIAAVALLAQTWSSLAANDEIYDAVRTDDLITLKALLKSNPALVISKDGDGDTPLHWAADYDYKGAAELLLAHGANVNAKNIIGETPLHRAAANGHMDVVELLLASKADVNGVNLETKTKVSRRRLVSLAYVR
jgi:ankyrin repeat protein